MDLPQVDSLHAIATKAKLLIDAPMALLASSIIKDEEGQIKWSSIITGGLTAGMIASASSLISMQQTLTELRTVARHRAPDIEKIPQIDAKMDFALQEITALKTGSVAATSERFRASDGARLEARLEKTIDTEVSRLERKIEEVERRARR